MTTASLHGGLKLLEQQRYLESKRPLVKLSSRLKFPFFVLLLLFIFSSCRTAPPDYLELPEEPDLYPGMEELYVIEDLYPIEEVDDEEYILLDDDLDELLVEDQPGDDPAYDADDLYDEPIIDDPVDQMLEDILDLQDADMLDPALVDQALIDEEQPLDEVEIELLLEVELLPEEEPLPVLPEPPPVEQDLPPPPLELPLPQLETLPPPIEPPAPPLPPAFLRPPEPDFPPPPPVAMVPMPGFHEPPAPRPLEPSGDEIVISRIVRAAVGQIIEIPFWGTGWIYLGELGNRRGVNYSSRRLDIQAGVTIGQTFVFIAEIPGTYILRFFRQDFIQDYLLRDYVQVIVYDQIDGTGMPGANNRVIAEPRWPLPMDPHGPVMLPPFETDGMGFIQMPLTPDAYLQIFDPALIGDAITQIPLPPAFPPVIESQADFVERARQAFDAANVELALSILDDMRQHHPFDNAEAIWLRAQLLEANSPARDIRQSLEYYHRLVWEFPQSIRVPEARRRIAFLERFFFNIR